MTIELRTAEQQIAQQSCSQTEIDYSCLLSNLPGMAYRCRNDKNWTMEFVSAGCFELTGYHPADILHNKTKSFADLIKEEDRARIWMITQAALLHRQAFHLTYQIVTASGEMKWVSEQGIGIYAPDGSVEALEGFITDITRRKLAEQQLLASEMRFRKIFETAPIGIAMSASDFHFISANHTFCQMLGYTREELQKLTFKDITHPEHVETDAISISKLLTGDIKIYQTEKRYVRKDGRIVWGALIVSPVYDPEGKFIYFLCMISDVTKRKIAEIELTRLNEKLIQQDKTRNEFVSTVTHELRTPLCVFKNIVSNAMAGVDGPIRPKLRKSLEMANENIDRLSRIVNDFLDIARMEAGKMQLDLAAVSLNEVICQVVNAFTPVLSEKHASIEKLLPQSVLIIEADRDKLIQILTNLVGNANKYIQPNGHILVTLSDKGDSAAISVHDDGLGIEPDKLEKIFDRFELGADAARSCHPSTGLGLSISKELVELHQGRIYAQSVPGRGSTFTVILPKQQSPKR